jgi:hypothetical protein
MNKNREKMRQAYLDGELSAIESSEFEATLDAAESEQLAAEVRFENGLAERLAQDAKCPEDVWERTKALLAEQHVPARPVSFSRWYWGAATFAAAASIVFFVTVFPQSPLSPSAVVMAAESVDELAASAESESGPKATQAYLRKQGIELKLRDADFKGEMVGNTFKPSLIHGDIHILGARMERLPSGKPVVEILFGCCRKPVKVLMAEKGSNAAFEIGEAAAARTMNHILDTRSVDGYITAVVGIHKAHGLLDIFEEQNARASDI